MGDGYNSKDDWCSPARALQTTGNSSGSAIIGPQLPIMSPNPYLLSRFTSNIPMPTLYAGDSVRKLKFSVIEVLLYNMAALLAGVAAGYDVRMSNVSPVHPSLLSDVPALRGPIEMDMEMSPTALKQERGRFAANTYHGTVKHNRTPLSSSTYAPTIDPQRSLRSDSPQTQPGGGYYSKFAQVTNSAQQLATTATHLPNTQLPSTLSSTSGLGSNITTNTSGMLSSSLGSHTQPPTPSPRRKKSTSSFTEQLEYSERDDTPPLRHYKDFRIGQNFGPPPLYAPEDYLRNGPSFSNDCGSYGTGAHRTGYFGSNYFPHRPEINFAYERDCKSYPDYSYDYHQHRLPNYYNYNYSDLQESPQHQQQTRTPPPRVPQMGVTAAGHRRTPSTISNISSSSNINQGFTLEQDELPELYRDYNNLNLNITTVDYGTSGSGGTGASSSMGSMGHYRTTVTESMVPPPTKQELYTNSPKLAQRLNRLELNVSLRSGEFSANRVRDYENLPAYLGSPLHKTKYQSTSQPHQQTLNSTSTQRSNYTTHTRSTPMSPINMKPLLLQERPASLPFEQSNTNAALGFGTVTSTGAGTKLRSSLKKYNFKTPNGGANGSSGAGASSSQQGTPTNATPPDSLTSDDSSYMSAKEGSISSQHSRVRFSPEAAFLDAHSSTTVGSTSAGITGQPNDYLTRSSLSLINRRVSRRHTSDISSSPSPSS